MLRLRSITTSVTVLVFCLVFTFVQTAVAQEVQLSGRVTDQSGNPLTGSTVDALSTGTSTIVATGSADASGSYLLLLASGTYDIRVTPPGGSGLGIATAPARSITSNSQLDFVLVPVGAVTLSGRLLDGAGSPLAGQTITMRPTGGTALPSITTDATGVYSFTVSSGDYQLQVAGSVSDPAAAPHYYYLMTRSFTLATSTVKDLRLPVKRVDVHVQDSSGRAVADVALSTGEAWNYNLSIGDVSAYGYSDYWSWVPARTDAAGNATMWLFPTDSSNYTITAAPPTGSGLAITNLTDVAVASDTSLTVTLATPVTMSGRLLDGAGSPLAGQTITMRPSGGTALPSITTDATGVYSFTVSPGDYQLQFAGSVSDPAAAPHYYYLMTRSFTLTTSTVKDLRLPVKRVDVHVQDSSGRAVADVALSTGEAWNYNLSIGDVSAYGYSDYWSWVPTRTDAAGNATMWLFPTDSSTYTITAAPPTGSGLAITNLTNVAVASDTSLTVTLATPVTMSGRLLDGAGNPLAGQTITMRPAGGTALPSITTDASGAYSFAVSPGDYQLQFAGSVSDPAAAPHYYYLMTRSFSLTADTAKDLRLPVKRVDVHVQDLAGNAVANVALSTGEAWNYNLSIGDVPAYGYSDYWSWVPTRTDTLGNATMWLFPTDWSTYTITAAPPSGGPFATFNVQNVSVTENKQLFVVLQFVHDPPVTTISVTPAPDSNGVSPDPVTVALFATASTGFTVQTTSYTIDGGPARTYTGPFTVTGAGAHTIQCWSVDNVGVFELKKTASVQIVSDNVPPTTVASISPAANANGWNNSDVTVLLRATDNAGGTGVRDILYSMAGAQTGGGTVTGSEASFTVFAEGTTTLTYYGRDMAGNQEALHVLTIRIDKTAPVLTVPSAVISEATSANGDVVHYAATAEDAVLGSVAVSCAPAADQLFPLGDTTVTCSASDLAGNTAHTSFVVSVKDTTPPTIGSVTATPNVLWPPNHKMITVGLKVAATDLVTPAQSIACRVSTITSNEPDNGLGDGDTAPDWFFTGTDLTVSLRAERAGNGTGRVYSVSVVCQDLAGNVSRPATATVTVPIDQAK